MSTILNHPFKNALSVLYSVFCFCFCLHVRVITLLPQKADKTESFAGGFERHIGSSSNQMAVEKRHIFHFRIPLLWSVSVSFLSHRYWRVSGSPRRHRGLQVFSMTCLSGTSLTAFILLHNSFTSACLPVLYRWPSYRLRGTFFFSFFLHKLAHRLLHIHWPGSRQQELISIN